MADKFETARILAEEYGITTMEELDAAIRNMKGLDITMFCYKPPTREEDAKNVKRGKGKKKG